MAVKAPGSAEPQLGSEKTPAELGMPGSAEPQLGSEKTPAELGLGVPRESQRIVKRGYKQTEVGVIPEEWEVLRIDQIFQFKQGVQFPVEQQVYVEREGYKRFIRIIDLTDPSVPWRYVADPGPVHHILSEDLFMVRYGSPGLLGFGHTGVIANNLFRLIPKRKIGADFYFQYLASKKVDIADISGSSTMPAVNFSTLGVLKLVYPPLPEQRAIATALSDVDALLAALDRLIAKKRDLKQAAMQQLLTGQIRLPGFHGEWEVKRLAEICEIAMGRTPPRLNQAYWGRGYKWLSIADLQTKVVSTSNEEITELAASMMTIIPEGTLLMSFKLSLGRLCFAGCDLFTNEAICSFNKLQANAEFLYYVLGRTDFSLYGKLAVKGYTLNKESLKTIEVSVPPLPEQIAIAKVLSDMDTELAALEQRREKTHALKQAMMQDLLTGRTRLI